MLQVKVSEDAEFGFGEEKLNVIFFYPNLQVHSARLGQR